MLNKVRPMILLKSKSFDFGISKPPNISKFKGIFRLNHFDNIFFQYFFIGFLLWLSSKESR